jgi:hypothetical protein
VDALDRRRQSPRTLRSFALGIGERSASTAIGRRSLAFVPSLSGYAGGERTSRREGCARAAASGS